MTLTPSIRIDTDVAIIGSGFGGSLTALALRARGQRVVLIERGRHPRFAIGESSTPLANLLLEELAVRYDLPQVRPFCKWGSWQRLRPDVACGLKRGFTFLFSSARDSRSPTTDDHHRQLLVAASPHDAIADTHWYRPQFDQALAEEAQRAGAEYLDVTRLEALSPPRRPLDPGWRARRPAGPRQAPVSSSMPAAREGFLHRALHLEETPLRWLPPTQGLYTHFEGVERWDRLYPGVGVSSVSAR